MRSYGMRFAAVGALYAAAGITFAQVEDLSAQFRWRPVRIGAGGFVVGMTLHPMDPEVRYARTDVGNAYRWSSAAKAWIAMRVLRADGTGVQDSADNASPTTYGIESIAVDPNNKLIVYMVFPALHSCDVAYPTRFVQMYKSTDGGRNFRPGGLVDAKIEGDPNGEHRQYGERLVIDPEHLGTMFYGSEHQGLYRSQDGGATWKQLGGGVPGDVEFINVQIDVASHTLYAVSIRKGTDAGGDVYLSADGGETWKDISAGVSDGGTSLAHQAAASSLGVDGRLYVVENPETNGGHRAYWSYAGGHWKRVSLEGGGKPAIAQPLTSIVADPLHPGRLYAMGADTGMSRSDDDGATWKPLGSAQFANTLGWLPQTVGMSGGGWRSNGGLRFDAVGDLWVPTGQEGVLTMHSADAARATAEVPARWTISSVGIEEQVAQDAIIPRGGGDMILAAAEDTTGFVVRHPETYSSPQLPLQAEIIAQGTAVDAAPDVPTYLVITSSNVYHLGPGYSGFSDDGGTSWKRFGAGPMYDCDAKRCETQAGQIAVSVRGERKAGQDHLVVLPPFNLAPQFSKDGGKTWKVSKSFPLLHDGVRLDTQGGVWNAFANPSLHQHLLRADPFIADRFYLKLTHAPAPLYISNDGGATWLPQSDAGLPDGAFHGQLVVNPWQPGELWYADGWEGSAAHGVWRSTDSGAHFQRLGPFRHAIAIGLGKGRSRSGDRSATVYVYGQIAEESAYGIFQSTDDGVTWTRIAAYPLGIYDRPVVLAASPDTYGRLVIGWNGNSFAYSDYVPQASTQTKAGGENTR